MIEKYTKGKVLVQIDAANLESTAKDLGWHIDYQRLKNLFDHDALFQIRHYCVHHGTDNQNKFFTFLKHHGYLLVTKPIKIIRQDDIERGDIRKANFDVEVSVDAMDLFSKYETLALFSGDSDFHYLVKLLKRKGKRVIILSSKYHVSRELIESGDKYIDLIKIKDQIIRDKKGPSFATGS